MSTVLRATSKGRIMARNIAIFSVLGAVVGFLFHRFVGCRTGTCPITANPYISTIYGAIIGALFSSGRG